MSRRHRSVVTVLSGGLSLSLAACSGKEAQPPPGNPPGPPVDTPTTKSAPDAPSDAPSDTPADAPADATVGGPSGRTPADHSGRTMNPPPPPQDPPSLPPWEAVESGHPEGATNPPRPVLVILEDGTRCWKEWQGGMMPPDEELLALGGRVITDPSQTTATEIQCPRRRVQSILDKKHARDTEGQ